MLVLVVVCVSFCVGVCVCVCVIVLGQAQHQAITMHHHVKPAVLSNSVYCVMLTGLAKGPHSSKGCCHELFTNTYNLVFTHTHLVLNGK